MTSRVLDRDVLGRHRASLHGEAPAASLEQQTTASRRHIYACVSCAASKIACDKAKPCSRCADKNIACMPRIVRKARRTLRRDVSSVAASDYIISNVEELSDDCGDRTMPKGESARINPDVTEALDWHDRDTASTLAGHNAEAYSAGHFDMELFVPEMSSMGSSSMQLAAGSLPTPQSPETVRWMALENGIETNPFGHNGSACSTLGYFPSDMSLDASMFHVAGQELTLGEPLFGTVVDPASLNNVPDRSTTVVPSEIRNTANLGLDESMDLDLCTEAAGMQYTTQNAASTGGGAAKYISICSSTCPQSTCLNLVWLAQQSREPSSSWRDLELQIDTELRQVPPSKVGREFTESIRGRLTESIKISLRQSLAMHGEARYYLRSSPQRGDTPHVLVPGSNILPSCRAIQRLLDRYAEKAPQCIILGGLTPKTAASNATTVNGRADPCDQQPSAILYLLMIALGAMTVPCPVAQQLAAALTEIGRTTMFAIYGQQQRQQQQGRGTYSSMAAAVTREDPHCAVLMSLLLAWSKNVWLRDMMLLEQPPPSSGT